MRTVPSAAGGAWNKGKGPRLMSYHVKIEIFEGPMDLLLHLIKKHELDIYDIPIAPITQQYLEYLELMQSLDMEVAGEFLVMASTLTHIKSKMLLPPPENPEDEDDGTDPRAELIRRLLEYKRFKDAAQSLEEKEAAWSQVYTRSADAAPELPADDEPLLFDFHLFEGSGSRAQVIATFLALLELMKTRAVKAVQVEQYGAIRLMKAVTERGDRDTETGNLFG